MTMTMNSTETRVIRRWFGLALAAPAFLLCAALAVGQEAKSEAPAETPSSVDAADDLDAAKLESELPIRAVKTDAEWRRLLTREQYMVTRLGATEPAFSGRYATGHYKGTFVCVCCHAPLFDARTKFDSGTGWPSFWRPLTAKAMTESLDRTGYEPRIEVRCSRCGAHLGHVFADGPPPTGLRYCINSLALKLDPQTAKATTKQKSASRTTTKRRGTSK